MIGATPAARLPWPELAGTNRRSMPYAVACMCGAAPGCITARPNSVSPATRPHGRGAPLADASVRASGGSAGTTRRPESLARLARLARCPAVAAMVRRRRTTAHPRGSSAAGRPSAADWAMIHPPLAWAPCPRWIGRPACPITAAMARLASARRTSEQPFATAMQRSRLAGRGDLSDSATQPHWNGGEGRVTPLSR